jgi:hypothetical protein
MAFWIGIYPKPFFAVIEKPVERIVRQVNPGFYPLVPAQSAETRAISEPAEVK